MPTIEITVPRPHAKQREILDNSARFNVLNCGRRFGKNVLLHDRMIYDLLHGHPVGWGSPTYKNFTDDWRTLVDLLAPVTRRKSETDYRIETVTGGVLEMWTLEKPGPIRGRKYANFYINEAAHAPYLLDTWNKIIASTLVDLHGGGWLASTPNGLNDWHTLYTWGLGSVDGWRSWTYTSYDNPHIDPAELDRLRLTMSDIEYRQEIMAEFIQSSGAVFRNLTAALLAPRETPAEHHGHTIVGGVDWGQSNDFTVLALNCVDCGREVDLDRYNQIDYAFQLDRLETMHKRWDVRRWLVELNSMGKPLFEQLVRRGLPVTGFETTQVSKPPLVEAFALALERGEMMLLNDDAGRAELQAYTSKQTATGHRVYSAPPGMHDDTVIARALAYRLMRETHVANPQRREQNRRLEDALRRATYGGS